jgi:hypothetical protein
MTKKTSNIMVAVSPSQLPPNNSERLAVKPSMQPTLKVLVIFKLKRPRLLFQDWFSLWMTHQVHTATSVKESLVVKGIKRIPCPPICQMVTQQTFFLSKVYACWPLAVPGQLQD